MLAYASDRSRLAERRPAPHAMLAIIGAHIAAVALLMSAKMDIPIIIKPPVIDIYDVPVPKDPPPPQPRADPARPAPPSSLDAPPSPLPLPPRDELIVPDPTPPQPGPIPGPALDALPQPLPLPQPLASPVRVGPRFATPPHLLRPPYPPSKIARDEEATLRLRLSIDSRGRVVAVDPVGRADPAFLDAARRHLIAKWRYQPATEGGRPVASSTVITLRFELEG